MTNSTTHGTAATESRDNGLTPREIESWKLKAELLKWVSVAGIGGLTALYVAFNAGNKLPALGGTLLHVALSMTVAIGIVGYYSISQVVSPVTKQPKSIEDWIAYRAPFFCVCVSVISLIVLVLFFIPPDCPHL